MGITVDTIVCLFLYSPPTSTVGATVHPRRWKCFGSLKQVKKHKHDTRIELLRTPHVHAVCE
jgi:hypothetical protein